MGCFSIEFAGQYIKRSLEYQACKTFTDGNSNGAEDFWSLGSYSPLKRGLGGFSECLPEMP
jgi:hypothetical protein